MNLSKWKKCALAAALAAVGAVVGANMSPSNVARGEVRGTPEPPTFQNGSVPVLKEISGTLRQIDARIARLEAVAQKMQTAAVRSAVTRAAEPAEEVK